MINYNLISYWVLSPASLNRLAVSGSVGSPLTTLYQGKPWVYGEKTYPVRFMIDDDIGVRGVESRVAPLMLEEDLGLLS